MMSITSSVAQQYELINELDASLVGGKPAFQAICPFGYDGLTFPTNLRVFTSSSLYAPS